MRAAGVREISVPKGAPRAATIIVQISCRLRSLTRHRF